MSAYSRKTTSNKPLVASHRLRQHILARIDREIEQHCQHGDGYLAFAIVQTFYDEGASFDVASMAEFLIVHEKIKHLPAPQRQGFIWDRIIYANPIKAIETLKQLDQYKPLVTYDNHQEVLKVARYAPHAGLALRLRVPNTGSMVELSSKFGALPGEAVDLIAFAHNNKLEVEG